MSTPHFDFRLWVFVVTPRRAYTSVLWSYYSHKVLGNHHLHTNMLVLNSNLSQIWKEISKHIHDCVSSKSLSHFDSKPQKKMSDFQGNWIRNFWGGKLSAFLHHWLIFILTKIVWGPIMCTHFPHFGDHPSSSEPDNK